MKMMLAPLLCLVIFNVKVALTQTNSDKPGWIPPLAFLSYTYLEDNKFIKSYNEILDIPHTFLETIDPKVPGSLIEIRYGQETSLSYHTDTKACSVEQTSLESKLMRTMINEIVDKGVYDPVKFEYVEGEKVYTVSEKETGSNRMPVSLKMSATQLIKFDRSTFYHSDDMHKYFHMIPDDVECTGLMNISFPLQQLNYNVLVETSEGKIDELEIRIHDENKIMLLNSKKFTYGTFPERALQYQIDHEGLCSQSLIPMPATDHKLSFLELTTQIWRDIAVTPLEYDYLYQYPLYAFGRRFDMTKLRLKQQEQLVIFGRKYENASVIFTGYINEIRFYKFKVMHKGGVDNLEMIMYPEQNFNFKRDLEKYHRHCSPIHKRKRYSVISKVLPERKFYQFDKMDNILEDIRFHLNIGQYRMHLSRVFGLKGEVKGNKLALEFEVVEQEEFKKNFVEHKNVSISDKPINETTGTLYDCYNFCYKGKYMIFTHTDGKCLAYSFQVEFKHDEKSPESVHVYQPYLFEISNNDGFQNFKEHLDEFFVVVNGDNVRFSDVIVSVNGETVEEFKKFSEMFDLQNDIQFKDVIPIYDVQNYADCGEIALQMWRDENVIGFQFDAEKKLCAVAYETANISVNLRDSDKVHSFKINPTKIFEQRFEGNIRKNVEEANLLSYQAKSAQECAEMCLKEKTQPCSSFFLCSDTCYVTDEFNLNRFMPKSENKSDFCTASRKKIDNFFERSLAGILKSNLPPFKKVPLDSAADESFTDSNILGYMVCGDDLNSAYIVDSKNIQFLYDWPSKPDLLCELHRKTPDNTQWSYKIVKVTEDEFVGMSKGGVAGLAITLLLIALLATFGIFYVLKRRNSGNNFSGNSLLFKKNDA